MLAAMVMFATVAFGQTAHVQGSHLEHGQLWQCFYDVHVDSMTYVTVHNGNDKCDKALPTGSDVPLVSIDKKKIKVTNSKGKEMTLQIVGSHE
jgi:hypothetical protein